MRVLNHILVEYTGKYLCDLSLMTLPFGGIYLTGLVFQLGMRFLFEDPTSRELFIKKLQNRAFFAPMLKKIPVRLILRRDLAIQGCLDYAF